MSAHRLERMASAIQRGVQQVLARGIADERVRGLITVTDVKVMGDLTEAVVSCSVLPAEHQSLTLHGLNSAAAHIRHELGELVDTRQLPRLRFRLDKGLKKQAALLGAIELAKEATDKREAEVAAKAAALAQAPPAERGGTP